MKAGMPLKKDLPYKTIKVAKRPGQSGPKP
jgi:hypothetical protein